MRDARDERARAEELEETRRTRRLLGESAGIGTWVFEPVDNRIEWSRDLLTLTGYAPDEISTPEQFYAVVHPADRKRLAEKMTAAVRTARGRLAGAPHEGGRPLDLPGAPPSARNRGQAGSSPCARISEDITELAKARDAARRGELKMKKAQREAQASAQRLAVALEAAEGRRPTRSTTCRRPSGPRRSS